MAVLGNVDAHFPCPNHCGESYRQEDIENHRDICRLEEITCEFSDVGCKQRFKREKQEEHVQENTQQHLSLAASQAISTHQQLQHHQIQLKEKLEEDNQKQNSSLKEVEEKIMEDIRGLRNIVQQQQQTLIGQEVKLKSQEQRLKKLKFERKVFDFFGFIAVLLLAFFIYFAKDFKEEGTHKLGKLQTKYRDLSSITEEIKTERRQTIQYLCALTNHVGQGRVVKIEQQTFEMKNFSSEKVKGGYWTSQAMYTHVCGYRFFLRVYPNGRNTTHEGVDVALVVTPGQFDDLLSWPAQALFTFLVCDWQHFSISFRYRNVTWNKPENLENLVLFLTTDYGGSEVFFYPSKVQYFLLNDTLKFKVRVHLK